MNETFQIYATAGEILSLLKRQGPHKLDELSVIVGNATLTTQSLTMLEERDFIDVDTQGEEPWYEPAYDTPNSSLPWLNEHWRLAIKALEVLGSATSYEVMLWMEAHGWVTEGKVPQRSVSFIMSVLEGRGVVKRCGKVKRKYSSRRREWILWRLNN